MIFRDYTPDIRGMSWGGEKGMYSYDIVLVILEVEIFLIRARELICKYVVSYYFKYQ